VGCLELRGSEITIQRNDALPSPAGVMPPAGTRMKQNASCSYLVPSQEVAEVLDIAIAGRPYGKHEHETG
tara:strand:- start:6626 stop:6835 length:210 start_codon:yes stop_codon:yes gene_type:complete